MTCKKHSICEIFTRLKLDALSGSLFLTASLMLGMSLIFYLISVFSV